MTVSKALRDAPDISAGTRERIKKMAVEMGYVPNSAAQGLRTRHTRLLGLVVSSVTNPIYSRIIMAIEEIAHELGYEVLLAQTFSRTDREEAVIRRLLTRRVDGLFLTPVYRLSPHAGIYDELRKRKVPTVILGHTAPFCAGFLNVETDDELSSYNLTQHLISLGHKRIAYFCGPPAAPSSHFRFEGYRRALRENGLPQDDNLVFQAGVTIEEGQKAALQFLQEKPGATAIQAVNDLVAIGTGNVLLSQGVRIPQDISLAGFGNVLTTEYYRVPLTTIRQPKYRLGVAAMEMMRKMIAGESVESKRLPAELAQRDSTAPPPHSETN